MSWQWQQTLVVLTLFVGAFLIAVFLKYLLIPFGSHYYQKWERKTESEPQRVQRLTEEKKKCRVIRAMICDLVLSLNDAQIRYFVSCGTLLGIWRDGDVIPWDDDADVIVLAEDEERLVTLLKDFEQESSGVYVYGRVSPNFHRMTHVESGLHMDYFIYETSPDDPKMLRPKSWLLRIGHPFSRWNKRLNAPNYRKDQILPLQKHHWNLAHVDVRVPSQVDDILATRYGPDWQTPKRTA